MEYFMHHHLEGCWAVGQSEIHHERFKESMVCMKCSLPFVSLANANIIIPPMHIQLHEIFRSFEMVD
jgi:hypothetical protein